MSTDSRHRQQRRRLLKATAVSPWLLSACDQAGQDKDADNNYLAPKKVYCSPANDVNQGVYYRPNTPMRNDIRESQTGALLHLKFKVVDVNKKCFPVAYARVEIWHADREGVYSDADPVTGKTTDGELFCRGTQATTPFGKAQFITVFPGWNIENINGSLKARSSHIMLRVDLEERHLLTTQCYFPDAIVEHINTLKGYEHRQQQNLLVNGNKKIFKRPVNNAADPLWSEDVQQNMVLETKPTSQGFEAEILIGVSV